VIKRNHHLSVRDKERIQLSLNMLSTKTHTKRFYNQTDVIMCPENYRSAVPVA